MRGRHCRRRNHHTKGIVAGLAGALVVGAGATAWVVETPSSRVVTTTRPAARVLRVVTPTASGPDGVRARWVVAENEKRGSKGWQITGTPPGTIAGFANRVSAQVGDDVTLYVTTDAATFHVDAYRMGWYGGDGARRVWRSPAVTGTEQPACPVTATTHMVSCDNWTPSLRITLTKAFVQGDYLFELYGSGGQRSYVPLTVTDPSSRAAYLVVNDVYTAQAWNTYGGYDFYQGEGACTPSYPPCDRATVVSFDRPYAEQHGAGAFFGNELPLVEYAEQHGLDVTYATDADVQEAPRMLLRHRAILTTGHDECWSLQEREAVARAASHGVNVVFFGAAAILRHVRMEPSPLGPDREEVDYRDSTEDPLDGKADPLLVTGNWWGSPPASWPEAGFVGEAYSGYLDLGAPAASLIVADASAWVFDGMGLHDGSSIPGVLASDFDQVDPDLHPADLQVLAQSPIPSSDATSENDPEYSDMTYYTEASKAGVFDTGTCAWIPDLSTIPAVAEMTGNVLRLFGAGPAGDTEPSVANWSDFVPSP